MTYTDYKEIRGRLQPMTMTLTPLDKPGEFTKLLFESLDLDVELPDSLFTLQALKP
jgi:hypothetical protein